MNTSLQPVGTLLREWRQRRRLSQLDLACDAEISTRHLSFIETGRARPSRGMLLHLADLLELPLRERNRLLVAAGFAPVFPERPLTDPALAPARRAVELVLKGHEPYPAIAVDRHWNIVAANRASGRLLELASPAMLAPPVNILRASLHADGLAPHIVNYAELRARLLTRLRRHCELTGDAVLGQLLSELDGYPFPPESEPSGDGGEDYAGVVMPVRIRTEDGELALFSTIAVFGTPVDITLSELALETFFPADTATAAILQRWAGIST
jgi:transcriptional regulator with XRE-family HTH domain